MSHLASTYKRLPVSFVRGEGVYLWDSAGKRYLDFLAGIAVCQLGHVHPRLVAALTEQAKLPWHLSNYFEIPEQEALAEALTKRSGLARAFFANSGAEANEAMIKLSRLWGKVYKHSAHEIIVLEGSFHGRTMATLSATGQERIREGFDPLVPSFKTVPANDIEELRAAVNAKTVAVLLEVIQGEGGVRPLKSDYLEAAQSLCREDNLLFFIDEVQTGMGRTGAWFGFQSVAEELALAPDAISLAKGLAGGLPMGACLMTEKLSELLKPGSHASTFGGSPLVARVALEMIHVIEDDELLEHTYHMGEIFRAGLLALQEKYSFIREIRGTGLLLGCELDSRVDASRIVLAGLEEGIILNAVQGHVLRFVPPLIIGDDEIAQGLEILDRLFRSI